MVRQPGRRSSALPRVLVVFTVFAAFAGFVAVPLALSAPAVASERPTALYDVRGGDPFFTNAGSSRCTVGFSVRLPSGRGGFVASDRCGSVGTATYGYNQLPQGVIRYVGPGYSVVELNDDWVPRPLVAGWGMPDVHVVGSREAPIGAAVCASSSTTGWRCGTLQAKNLTIYYPGGTLTGVSRASFCSEPGDLGAPVIGPGGNAQGLIIGGSGNCASGGVTYFLPLNPILNAGGLTLVTG